MLLGDAKLFANVAVSNTENAKKFYGELLGLELEGESMGTLVYKSTQGKLFVYPAPSAGKGQATCVTWQVSDAQAVVDELAAKGITFEHYEEAPGMKLEGDLHVMGEFKAAWFKDPDGNILSVVSDSNPNHID